MQLLVWLQSVGLVPEKVMELTAMDTFPELVSDSIWAGDGWPWTVLGKVKDAGEKEATAPVPVPDKGTVCGEPIALSVIVNAPVRVPGARGVNVTFTVQVAVGATLLQSFVWE